MITAFEAGKYYIWDCKNKEVENNPIEIDFNKSMMKWFDRKPRKCYKTIYGVNASFENLVNFGIWDYRKSMQYFKEYIPVRQEEMDI